MLQQFSDEELAQIDVQTFKRMVHTQKEAFNSLMREKAAETEKVMQDEPVLQREMAHKEPTEPVPPTHPTTATPLANYTTSPDVPFQSQHRDDQQPAHLQDMSQLVEYRREEESFRLPEHSNPVQQSGYGEVNHNFEDSQVQELIPNNTTQNNVKID